MHGREGSESRTVLIAEDDENMAALLRFYLEREGLQVIAAADGRQAAQVIEGQPPVDLAVVDFMLPHLDGLQLVKLIRGTVRWRETPVVMLTARSGEQDIVRVLDAGANDYIIKPFQPQELLARVRRLLKTSPSVL